MTFSFDTVLPPTDSSAQSKALARQGELTKPPGSLGSLENTAVQMAAFQGNETPSARPASALIFAADHPVTRHGISPYPSAVTRAMLTNFINGGAAASVLSQQRKLPLHVFDCGVEVPQGGEEVPLQAKVQGISLHKMVPPVVSGDIRTEPALCSEGLAQCLRYGQRAVKDHCDDDRVIILGEMGIGNTTSAAALAAYLLGSADPGQVVGAGTGAQGELLENKRNVVRDIVARLPPTLSPLEVLRQLAGREMVCVYGAMRAALAQRTIVLVDGFIITAIAALLVKAEPSARHGMIFAHRSQEKAHGDLLEYLEATPLLDLQMRLGEASGALAAYPLVESACALHNNMATFTSADIPESDT